MNPRRALIVTPRFFGYEEDIAAEFRRQGFLVDLVDERPSNSPFMKALFRLRASALTQSLNRYFRTIMAEKLATGYDLVLVIKGETVPVWFLEQVKADSPNAVFIFYTFDSVSNSSNFVGLLPQFDHLFSFQPGAEQVDPRFQLKYLFYAPEFRPLGNAAPRRHETAFIGTLHSGRYRFAQKFLRHSASSFGYFFVQARWYFALRRLVDSRYRAVPWREVSFEKLGRASVADIFRNSLAVLDMQHENQTGLTMRTFEVLASGSYLITTNAAIRATPLMDTGRVIVVDENTDPEHLVENLRSLPVPSEAPEGFDAYSLRSWVSGFVDVLGSREP